MHLVPSAGSVTTSGTKRHESRGRRYRRSPLMWLVTMALVAWPVGVLAQLSGASMSLRLLLATVGLAPELYWVAFWLTARHPGR